MQKQNANVALAVVCALLASGCESINEKVMSVDEASAGPYPARYREITRDYRRTSLLDPYSVRDSQISKPKMGNLFVEGTLGQRAPGWIVCVRNNAKNRMGAYGGIRDSVYAIHNDRVVASLSPTDYHYEVVRYCGEERYERFDEIGTERR